MSVKKPMARKGLLRFEPKVLPLLPRREFLHRQAVHAAFAAVVVGLSLAIGTVGYKVFDQRSWVDSEYSAAMILTGMGPAFEPKGDGAKVFASVYAVFSGVVFLTSSAVLIAPALHRFLHRMHMDDDERGGGG